MNKTLAVLFPILFFSSIATAEQSQPEADATQNSAWAPQFDVSGYVGMRITGLNFDSICRSVGLQVGDIVVSIDKIPLAQLADSGELAKLCSGGKGVEAAVIRTSLRKDRDHTADFQGAPLVYINFHQARLNDFLNILLSAAQACTTMSDCESVNFGKFGLPNKNCEGGTEVPINHKLKSEFLAVAELWGKLNTPGRPCEKWSYERLACINQKCTALGLKPPPQPTLEIGGSGILKDANRSSFDGDKNE